MSLDYKGFEWGNRITSDYESVDRFLHEKVIVPQSPSIGDLHGAAEWLATYASETAEDAQGWANVVAFLILTAESKEKRSALAKAKKKFAKEKGIPVSQVRINRNN
jgi:LPS O-antigen subunit length determinant protein (WzzB/FepE family)